MLLFFSRYVGFIHSFPVIKFVYNSIQTDYDTLKQPVERKILMEHIDLSKRTVLIFLRACCLGIVSIVSLLSFPIVFNILLPQKESRNRYLKLLGFIVNQDKYVDLVTLHVILTTGIGLLVITCTESTLSVCAYYICGLFQITGYRVRSTIADAAKWVDVSEGGVSDYSGIREAVTVHKKCIKIINELVTKMMVSYLVAILLVVMSFGVNLYHCFLGYVEMGDPQELVLSTVIVSIHVVIMFLNNLSGQLLIDNSRCVFYETYNSMWYRTPPSMQKLVLMILHRSSIDSAFNLSNLFIPCFEGFSAMLSTSFSYFTMLYSTQPRG
ncbi:uncharacterized protein LOC128889226 isoform X1 [Hylaeus anthracinus]|uniref:uncharacterized protein LOC128889226 isoform X1 n=1 Tax=Hylaeus anthracinus TaxID=313031 RepID=UPI0023B9D89C|nr:uncharacterized protein LOC128889226 isoform X1 [Hylaeus anthracinus]